MGKTVSLVRLWQTLLDRCKEGQKGPVPVFIALNEYNQPRPSADFIVNAICKNYLDSTVTGEELLDLPKTPPERYPFLLLLLDGFNEITVDKQELLLEINRLLEQAPGVQLIFTSRFGMRFHQQWQDFNLLQLQKLEDEQIEDYLQSRGIPRPAGRLKKLVANPMMLTLYAASCDVVKMHGESAHCDFKEEVETPGELLWNFMESQVARLPERLAKDRAKITLYGFLLKFLLPFLGFEMEKEGLFYFSLEQLNEHVDACCRRFGREDFFAAFSWYEVLEEGPWFGECESSKVKRKRQRDIRDILTEELLMLVVEDGSFRFLHQDFRDYFAAVHVLNELQVGLKEQSVPGLLREGALSFFVRRFLGEIDGQHRVRPLLMEGEGWFFEENKEAILYKALNLCRGDFSGDTAFAVWNIVETWKELRGELSGADLSRLDLSKANFNAVLCSRFYEGKYVSALFNESLLHAVNLFPQGHPDWVTSAVYSGDGKKILSASWDGIFKEWDAQSGQCLKTYKGDSYRVPGTENIRRGNNILETDKNEIKIKNPSTGEVLKTLINIPGLWIQGCSFAHLHPDCRLSEEDRKLLKMYGALL